LRQRGLFIPMQVVRRFVKSVYRLVILNARIPLRYQRRIANGLSVVAKLPDRVLVVKTTLGGRPAERIMTPTAQPNRVLLYLHGGGYTFGSPATHRAVAAHLAARVGAVCQVIDYRLAPEHPYPAAVEDALAAYRELVDWPHSPRQIAVAGDSAGGGLALALALRIRQLALPQPVAIGLISPLVDARVENAAESIDDPVLTPEFAARCIRDYAGRGRASHEVSPLLADLTGLPPLFVHAGSDEILLDGIEQFVATARTAGVQVTYQRLEGHWHVTHIFAGLMREADAAVEQLAAWLRDAYVSASEAPSTPGLPVCPHVGGRAG
jgi:acetyl esterase/lipase